MSPLSGKVLFRCSQIAGLDSGLQHLACLVAHDKRQYRRGVSHRASGTAQHSNRIVDILQDVVAKNDVERSRRKQVATWAASPWFRAIFPSTPASRAARFAISSIAEEES